MTVSFWLETNGDDFYYWANGLLSLAGGYFAGSCAGFYPNGVLFRLIFPGTYYWTGFDSYLGSSFLISAFGSSFLGSGFGSSFLGNSTFLEGIGSFLGKGSCFG